MKAKELRVDNIIYYNNSIRYISKIDSTLNTAHFLMYSDDGFLINETEEDLEYIEPIPLTKAILIQLGFKTNNTHGYYYIEDNNNELILIESDNGYMLCDMDIMCKVTYVHHLQNVCYDLMGLELIIK